MSIDQVSPVPAAQVKANILGLIRSIKLTESNYLFPLFEAVVNAIQAVQERAKYEGRRLQLTDIFDIYIRRPKSKQSKIQGIENNTYSPITGFEIVDNGMGFFSKNCSSFEEAYTPYKLELGCKGVGRFMMLAAFERVRVESKYFEPANNAFYYRDVKMSIQEGIVPGEPSVQEGRDFRTVLYLEGYKQNFLKSAGPDVIAKNVLEHWLIYFIHDDTPTITLYDDGYPEPIVLHNWFKEVYDVEDTIELMDVCGQSFELLFVKNYRKKSHRVHYCASRRVVQEVAISSILPVLNKHPFFDEEKAKEYYIDIYCSGDVLTEAAQDWRTEFSIPKKKVNKRVTDNVSIEELNDEVGKKVVERYGSEIASFEEENLTDVRNYIFRENMVEYRHLIDFPELLKSIPSGLNDNEIEEHLHKINFEQEQQQRARANELLSVNVDRIQNTEEYKAFFNSLDEFMNTQVGIGQSRLAKYMMHRKTILKIFEKYLEWQENSSSYKYEKDIHDIIFKRKNTNDNIRFNEHNLWILDERLAYHQYIASDKKFNEIESVEVNSEEAADLFIYNKKFAYGLENESVIIFEFKRPMRTNYTNEEKDLGGQIVRYVNTLIDKQTTNSKGRPHGITEDTPKFGYVICDFTPEIEKVIQRNSYKKTTKGTYLKYEEGLGLFVEIMNYDQLLNDVNLRHKAFFSELGIGGI